MGQFEQDLIDSTKNLQEYTVYELLQIEKVIHIVAYIRKLLN